MKKYSKNMFHWLKWNVIYVESKVPRSEDLDALLRTPLFVRSDPIDFNSLIHMRPVGNEVR